MNVTKLNTAEDLAKTKVGIGLFGAGGLWTVLRIGAANKLILSDGMDVVTIPAISYRNGHGKPGRKGGKGQTVSLASPTHSKKLSTLSISSPRVPAAYLTQELIDAIGMAEGVSPESIKEVFESFYDKDLGNLTNKRKRTQPTPKNNFVDSAEITFSHVRLRMSTQFNEAEDRPRIFDLILNEIGRHSIKPVEINGKTFEEFNWPTGGVTVAAKMRLSTSQPVSGDLLNVDITAGVSICCLQDLFNRRLGCKIAYLRLKAAEQLIAQGKTAKPFERSKSPVKQLEFFGTLHSTLQFHKEWIHVKKDGSVQIKSPYYPKGSLFNMTVLGLLADQIEEDFPEIYADSMESDAMQLPVASLGAIMASQLLFGMREIQEIDMECDFDTFTDFLKEDISKGLKI
jgi:hypothetical protein